MKVNAIEKNLSIHNKLIGNRKNIIVIGDVTDDAKMVDNVDYDNLISILFLNTADHSNLTEDLAVYWKKYDVVIANNGSFEVPN